jgi:hypothetical protein
MVFEPGKAFVLTGRFFGGISLRRPARLAFVLCCLRGRGRRSIPAVLPKFEMVRGSTTREDA